MIDNALDRQIIGTRLDSLLVLAGDDPTKVDWKTAIDELSVGEWPTIRHQGDPLPEILAIDNGNSIGR